MSIGELEVEYMPQWDTSLGTKNIGFDDDGFGAFSTALNSSTAIARATEPIRSARTWYVKNTKDDGSGRPVGVGVVAAKHNLNEMNGQLWYAHGLNRGDWKAFADDINCNTGYDQFKQGDVIEVHYDPATHILSISVAGKATARQKLKGDLSEVYPCLYFSERGKAAQTVDSKGRNRKEHQEEIERLRWIEQAHSQ